jgi:hypothetical protein
VKSTALPGLRSRPHEDFDVTPQCGKEINQPLRRKAAQAPPQHTRDLGLIDPHERRRFLLREASFPDHVVD